MRTQDFLSGKLEDVKFRISVPGELITTQEDVDDFAIGFMEWCQYEMPIKYFAYHTSIALLEIYKKRKRIMSISRNLERDIDSVKTEVDSVIQQLLDIIDDQEKEIENLNDEVARLEEILEENKL